MKLQRQPSQLINFLQNENKSIIDSNKQLKELLDLNRKALKIALAPRQNEESLPTLVSLLFQQNGKLLKKTQSLQEAIEMKSCQALISEQIASASNEHEKYVASQLKERLKILRKEIESKDKLISDLQKQLQQGHHPTDNDEAHGVIQYTDMNKISEKMFKEAQNLRRQIDQQSIEINRLKQQKDQLIKLNLILTRQVNELKMYSCQSTVSQKRQFNSSSSDLSRFLKYQSKIAENSDDQSDEEQSQSSFDEQELSEEVEQEVVEEIKKVPTLNLGIKDKQASILGKSEKNSKVALPKLQLKKAKQIQNLIVKKINNDQKKKSNHQNPKDEKWKKLQGQIQDMRKKLGNEMVLKLKFERENAFLKKFISELQNRNQLILRENNDRDVQKNYEKQRQIKRQQNVQTLLDICRDVTLNERLRSVCKGKDRIITKKDIYSKQI